MGMFCSCGAQINRRYDLCPKCDTERIKARIVAAKEDAENTLKADLENRLRAERKEARETFFYSIQDEIMAHKEKRSEVMRSSKALCDTLPFEVRNPSTYISLLFKNFGLEAELLTYRTKVIRTRTGKATYESGKGLAGMTADERTSASKKAYGRGLGLISTEDRMAYGRATGERLVRENKGIFGLSHEERSKISSKSGKIGGQKTYDNKVGLFQYTSAELSKMSQAGKKKAKKLWEAKC